MRRSALSVAAATLATALLLAGCGSDPEPAGGDSPTDPADPAAAEGGSPDTSAADAEVLTSIDVEGAAGTEPTITFDSPLTVEAPAAAVATPGDGADLANGDLLLLDFVSVDGADREVVESTYDGDRLDPLVLGDPNVFPALTETLTGEQVGVRVLFASPGQETTTVMSLEVVDTRPTRAEGTAVEPDTDAADGVTLAEDGEPTFEAVDAEPPTELVATPTIEGDGNEVKEGDFVLVNYSGWLWDGTPFDSSWSRGTPFSLTAGAGQVIEGWDTGLLGQTVGSQVLFVIPPELGYGDDDTETIPGGSTLVFVVDILYAG